MQNLIDSIENKQKILEEFLKICSMEGCTNNSLQQAFITANIPLKLQPIMFENGIIDLIEFYISCYNQKMIEEINQNYSEFFNLKIRQKIKIASFTRFKVEQNNQIALQRIINFLLNPKNLTSSDEYGSRPLFKALKINYQISDVIWFFIKDKSTDFNFYTKRLTLAKILLKSWMVFLKDDSPNLDQTSNFLDSQIEKVMKFEKYKARLIDFSSQIKQKLYQFCIKENGNLKSPHEVIKDLPFFRLFK